MDTESSVEGSCSIIPNDLLPYKGQEFETTEEAYDKYNLFAAWRGFSIRKYGGKVDKKSGEKRYRRFVCSKEGVDKNLFENQTNKKRQRNTSITRTGCQAKMSITLNEKGTWTVTQIVDYHNHNLASPSKIHFLRSQRKVSQAKIEMMMHYDNANIAPCKQIRIFESQSRGSLSSMGCIDKDLQNIRTMKRAAIEVHDAEMLQLYFESEKEKNHSYCYTIDIDDDGHLIRCFWADAKCRRSYAYFDDCVVIDSTYKTNKYHMIFATIAGVNHHRQTIVFGCALLSDEKIDSYKWLLNNWLQAMPSSTHPTLIITDQDAALSNAISEILPNTFHRYCLWHILQKFDKKLPNLVMRDYYHLFASCIKDSISPQEFNDRWMKAIEESGMVDNIWLHEIFDLRSRWVPAYCKHVFSAGMSSSQRAESSHSFFKKFVSEKNTLLDFITKFDMALRHQRQNELKSDHEDINQEPRMLTLYSIEEELRSVYTKKNFQRIQEEIMQSQPYLMLQNVEENEDTQTFSVSKDGVDLKKHEITFFINTGLAKCNCLMFEFEGIPCRHLIFFYRARQQSSLPKDYILSRWTKQAKSKRIWEDKSEIKDVVDDNLLVRHLRLSQQATTLVEKACLLPETSEYARQGMQSLIDGVDAMRLNMGVTDASSNAMKSAEEVTIKNPQHARTKGCGVGGRLKTGRELNEGKQIRYCQICGLSGHNRRTCPDLMKSKATTDMEECDETVASSIGV